MRLVSYNILDGGEGRADPLGEVIEAQKADIVVLVEADDLSVVERTARRLKMDFIRGGVGEKSAAILSRWTISESVNHAAMLDLPIRSFLQATIRDPAGNDWPIIALHLHPRASLEDEKKRLEQLDVIFERTQKLRVSKQPHLFCGDFNANSPIAKVEPDKLKPKSQEQWLANGKRFPVDVVQRMLDNDYIDTLACVNPSHAPTLNTFTTHHPGQRVDYIFAHGFTPAQIKDAWVERDRLAEFASDHYPVGVEINL